MLSFSRLRHLAAIMFMCLGPAPTLNAAITVTGNYSPAEPFWTNGGGFSGSYIGGLAPGTLLIDGGSHLSTSSSTLGVRAGIQGSATVTGPGSSWSNSYNSDIGDSGIGSLSIENGGSYSGNYIYVGRFADSQGSVTVKGVGSSLSASELHIGYSGYGTLSIEDGATVSTTSYTALNRSSYESNGTISLSNGTLTVGRALYADRSNLSGTGTISTHGLVGGGYAPLDFNGSNIAQTTLTENGDSLALTVTANGIGDLSANMIVHNGAQIHSINGYLGFRAGTEDTATVIGADSSWTSSSNLHIGYRGTGSLFIENGATVSAGASILAGTTPGSTATISLSDGKLIGRSLVMDRSVLSGTGTIEVKGLIGSGYTPLDFNGSNVSSTSLSENGDAIVLIVTADGSGDLGTDMLVRNGAQIRSANGYLGSRVGSDNSATVTGAGSSWSVSNELTVGHQGAGSLSIEEGANVSVGGLAFVANYSGSTGHISFSNGTFTAGTLLANRADLSGTGAIFTQGLTGGGFIPLDFNGSNIAQSTLSENGDSLTLIVTADGTGYLGADMLVRNSAQVTSTYGLLHHENSIVVTGTGSTWTISSALDIGSGSLSIENGGAVSSNASYIGTIPGQLGSVIVRGADSSWTLNDLYVGSTGHGILSITDGGVVSVNNFLEINTNGSINLQVSGNAMLNMNSNSFGIFFNEGQVNFYAGATLATGVYTPITASGGLMGSGSYHAYGGVWSAIDHTFTTTGIIDGDGGVSMDLSGIRLSFDESQLVTSFSSEAGVATFEAVSLSLTAIDGKNVLAAYAFSTDLLDGTTTLLSYYIGDSLLSDSFLFWHLTDGETDWTLYLPGYQNYTDGWLSFTVDSFSSYAITESVPEPGTSMLLAFGLGTFWLARRLKAIR